MELFYCYAYGRLSKEDGDKIESDSIKNQRDLIHSYIGQHPELKLVMEGYDDGYTGTNFERPYFKEMLEAVKEQKVQLYHCQRPLPLWQGIHRGGPVY